MMSIKMPGELPTVPPTGWRIVQVVDLFERAHDCAYCRKERVRYVHVVVHPEAGELRVGCVCAARLTGNDALPQELERQARLDAARYARFAAERHWAVEPDRQTRAGRHLHWDYMAMVYRSAGGWRWMLIFSGGKYRSTATFESPEAARRELWQTQMS